MADSSQNASTRYRMLDLIRGITVLLMVATHAVYFFHNNTGLVLPILEIFGNTVVFTTFLAVSAATAQVAYFSHEDEWPRRRKRLIKRVLVILTGYYILAFTVFLATITSTYGFDRIKLIFDIITLRQLASFAEFYIPFIIFPLIIAFLPQVFRKVTKSVFLSVIFGLAVYFLGMFYYQMPVWDFLIPWKALFFGAEGYYRFPIFQYFPIYLLGMVWGNCLLRIKDLRHQKEIAKAVTITALTGLAVAGISLLGTGATPEEIMRRWPPTIPFLLVGMIFASSLAFVFYKTNLLRRLSLLRDGLLVLGQNALGLALTHIFLLQIYSLSGGLRTGSVFIYLVSLIILLLLSLALSAIIPFNFKLTLHMERNGCKEHELEQEAIVRFEEEVTDDVQRDVAWFKRFFFLGNNHIGYSKKLVNMRHILGISLIIGLAALVVIPPFAQEYQFKKEETATIPWDSTEYSWRQNLTIKNNETLAEIPKGSAVNWQFNHAELVRTKKSYSNGADLQVKHWNGKIFQPVEYLLATEPNQSSTTLSIKLLERIKSGDINSRYYLYYGNNMADAQILPGTLMNTSAKYTIETKGEETYPLLLSVDRRWSIISNDPKVQSSLRVALQTTNNYSATEATYTIVETKTRGTLTKTTDKQWEGVLNTKGLAPGKYHLTAQINDSGKTINASKTGFFVSYPLYIAWTQDWEGYDVPDVYLSAITQVARDHGIVMTHFWNPRVTTTDTIAQNRKDTLLDWIKTRQSVFGESIQLHLHMFKDYVTSCGIEPKYYPNWGDSGDGYGSLATNYSTEEITKMISKAIDTMKSSGLGAPTVFRAGGWFANEETLAAVENSGLLADSSGRTAYKFYEQTGPWNLTETTQPYYPSKVDQNKTGSPALSILEIPNNGADSYWFSSEEMKKRFSANYSGGVLDEPKQITYLSHPHWFNKTEQAKIESVFDYIDDYKYDKDNGPAIYVTLEEIYDIWARR